MLRKLARVTFNVLAALSLLLCVAACALWVRSYWQSDHLSQRSERSGDGDGVSIESSSGVVGIGWRQVDGALREGGSWHYYRRPTSTRGPRRVHWSLLGFSRSSQGGVDTAASVRSRSVRMFRADYFATPHWFLVGVSAALPLWWLMRCRRSRASERSTSRGLCPACGYDLRATPGRCPECGAVPSSPAPAK